jgi:TolB-like protein/tetratricopeptide (TPR) repeat protein
MAVVEQRVERKLTAILAADVAGYSRLVGVDEEGTLAQLKALRRALLDPKIDEHRGRIVKTTGDGMLVQFASVVDAVRCAVEVQRQMIERNAETADEKRIEFRMGINVGDVVIDGEDIYGDGVNVAARLEGLSEPGGICVSLGVRDQVRDKLDLTFDDAGEQQLKNIARPVRVYRLRLIGTATKAAAALVLPDKPSIAVLPFQNMSGDPEQEYFADGVVEEIITALSRIRWLFVIARNSSFTYKGRAVDVKQVGRELGVRYVLEGSVRKAGNRVRITGQLIDVSTGAHIWADRFEGELANIFDLQDQVTASVVGAIEPKLEQAEMERAKRKPTESLDAYDHYLRGVAGVHQWTREGNNEALSHFKRAIEVDPNYASAFGMAARCYSQRTGFAWVTDREQEVADAERLARRAGELGKEDAVALSAAGHALVIVVGDIDDGAALIDRALVLNPNLAWAWHSSGFARISLGELEVAIEHVARGMRLSPQDPQMFAMEIVIAAAHLFAGRPDQAFSWAAKAIQERPNFFVGTCIAAASGALAGKLAQAEKAMMRLRQLNPALRISNLKDMQPFRRPEHLTKLADGLRMAGLPE